MPNRQPNLGAVGFLQVAAGQLRHRCVVEDGGQVHQPADLHLRSVLRSIRSTLDQDRCSEHPTRRGPAENEGNTWNFGLEQGQKQALFQAKGDVSRPCFYYVGC